MNDDVMRFSRDAHRSEVGQRFRAGGREYLLMGNLDNGAIGVVRKARDVASQQVVAVKFLAPEFRYIEASSWENIRERFRREGKRGTGLEHHNLVKILAFEENENGENFQDADYPWNPFIVMEFIQGKTLESFIRGQMKQRGAGVLNVTPHTLRIANAVTGALVYLHRRGIVHRDVKPGNIFLSSEVRKGNPGEIKLGDFGVVKWNDFLASMNSGQLTVTGQTGLGTLKYMSPEQVIKPKDVLITSDIYSLGATFFELFTNQVFEHNLQFFMITMARSQRGDTVSRLYDLGLGLIPTACEPLFSLILDMLARGHTSRPTATKVQGHLNFLLERIEGTPDD
jgi:serine/threonine-protein kinase